MLRRIFTILVLSSSAACSTTFNAVAPGPNGTVFVAGSEQNQPAVWVCPANNPGACRRVEVEVGE